MDYLLSNSSFWLLNLTGAIWIRLEYVPLRNFVLHHNLTQQDIIKLGIEAMVNIF